MEQYGVSQSKLYLCCQEEFEAFSLPKTKKNKGVGLHNHPWTQVPKPQLQQPVMLQGHSRVAQVHEQTWPRDTGSFLPKTSVTLQINLGWLPARRICSWSERFLHVPISKFISVVLAFIFLLLPLVVSAWIEQVASTLFPSLLYLYLIRVSVTAKFHEAQIHVVW